MLDSDANSVRKNDATQRHFKGKGGVHLRRFCEQS